MGEKEVVYHRMLEALAPSEVQGGSLKEVIEN